VAFVVDVRDLRYHNRDVKDSYTFYLSGAFTFLITLTALLKFERSSLMTIRRSAKKEE
jgi:hypothetical protein